MLQQLCQVAEARIRLDAFVAAHSAGLTAHASSASADGTAEPAEPAEADPILRCFVDAVADLLLDLTHDVQVLPGRVKWQRALLCSTSLSAPPTASAAAARDAAAAADTQDAAAVEHAAPLSPVELVLYSTPMHARLEQLAALCACAPSWPGSGAAASSSSITQLVGGGTGVALAPSEWEVQGFPSGTALLTRLHALLLQVRPPWPLDRLQVAGRCSARGGGTMTGHCFTARKAQLP